MAYPGNPELSPQAQDRVMTAFKQVVGKLQQGNREEALIGLEFVLRLDPAYSPAKNLHHQLSSGAGAVDLNDILGQLQAPTTEAINSLVIEAMEDFNSRDFDAARAKVGQVLLDLPGHEEARGLLAQIEAATKGESQVSQFLSRAREALASGDSQEAANFVMMAQALDPHHRGIAATIAAIERGGDVSLEQAGFAPEGTQQLSASEDAGLAADTDELFEIAEPRRGAGADVHVTDSNEAPDIETAAPGFGSEAPEFDTGAADFGTNVADLGADSPDFGDGGPDFGAAAPEFDAEAPHFDADPQPGPPAPHRSIQSSASGSAETYYEEGGMEADRLFETSASALAEDDGAESIDPNDPNAMVRDLLIKGGTAAAADHYAAAIDAWSRILLIDRHHEEAIDRIEHIRHAREELERRIGPMLEDAQAAHKSGDLELARDFTRRALELSPNHVEATRLKETIDRGAHPESEELAGEAVMPELEDDLFSDEFAATADFGSATDKPKAALEGEWRTPVKPKRRLPWQWWAAIGAVGLVIVGATMWFAGVFAPEPEGEPRVNVVNRVLREAKEMYNLKKVEEAILHLEQNSADDPYQVRIDNLLNEYRLTVATPVPTPVPEGLTACRDLLAKGRWMAAYERAMAELRTHPNDPGLEEVRDQILEVEPAAAVLYTALRAGEHAKAISVSKDLLEKRAGDAELMAVYDRILFNAALAELRAHNIPSAESLLTELAGRQPDDEEVQRILALAGTYKTKPVDMQLEVFVGSLAER
jgi:tetratricopeptide (TPR) repeat protein